MLLLLASLAHALSCGGIQDIFDVVVPVPIIVETNRGVGNVEAGAATCLDPQAPRLPPPPRARG